MISLPFNIIHDPLTNVVINIDVSQLTGKQAMAILDVISRHQDIFNISAIYRDQEYNI